MNDYDFFFILREIIDIINDNREEIVLDMNNTENIPDKKKNKMTVYKKIENEVKQRICFLINEKFPKIDFKELIQSIIIISRYMSSIFSENISKNMEVINNSYDKISIKEPYDIFYKLKQNTSVRNKYTSQTKLYIMDSIFPSCNIKI
jgi:hypothetical protein